MDLPVLGLHPEYLFALDVVYLGPIDRHVVEEVIYTDIERVRAQVPNFARDLVPVFHDDDVGLLASIEGDHSQNCCNE